MPDVRGFSLESRANRAILGSEKQRDANTAGVSARSSVTAPNEVDMLTTEQRLRMLEVPKGPLDMVLDTDAYNEIDDQYAISYALRASEKITVKAFYAAPFYAPGINSKSESPVDGMERSYHEILKVLRLAGEERLVFRGADRFLSDEATPVLSDAAKHLAELAMGYTAEKPLYVVAIGAITNVASALLLRPGIADRIVVVWLGTNSLAWHDNREFNCLQDVAAARVVLGSGAPVVLLPCMGVVSAFTTTEPELNFWLRGENKNELTEYLASNTIEEANSYAAGKVWSRAIWDVTTIGWLLNDDDRLMLSRLIPTPIPQYDDHLSTDTRRPLCRCVYHIERDALFGDLFAHLLK